MVAMPKVPKLDVRPALPAAVAGLALWFAYLSWTPGLSPALPGAITEGDTLAEALENARLVIAELLAVMEADGVAIPEEAIEPTLRVVEVA